MSFAIRSMGVAALIAVLASHSGLAQEKGKPASEDLTGVKVGEKAPGFRLKDQDGKERSLDEYLKKGKVALVFYRSADW